MKENGNVNYFENDRPEVFDLVTEDMRTILDVGCGKGVLGSKLKQANPGRKVFGLEYVEDVAEIARTRLDRVVIGDIERIEPQFEGNSLDCIIFADILEHLVDPASVLRKLKPFLKSGGKIICSIPNMRHYTVILRLIKRGWRYDDFGHFDRTHLRFFSKQTILELIEDSGFRIEIIKPRIVASNKMKLVNTILRGRLEEFLAFQYVVRAKNSP